MVPQGQRRARFVQLDRLEVVQVVEHLLRVGQRVEPAMRDGCRRDQRRAVHIEALALGRRRQHLRLRSRRVRTRVRIDQREAIHGIGRPREHGLELGSLALHAREREVLRFEFACARRAIRVHQWAPLHLHANHGAVGRSRSVVGEADLHRDAVVAPIGAAPVLQFKFDLAATRTG